MIKTQIISVGKIKEKSALSLIEEYQKRLSKYTDFHHTEIKDFSLVDNPNEYEIQAVLQKEADKIVKALPKNSVTVALVIDGQQYTSTAFADFINKNKLNGGLCFIIGSSHGLHKSILDVFNYKMSLSKMTFPHNLARLILTEQIYRGFKIIEGSSYHK